MLGMTTRHSFQVAALLYLPVMKRFVPALFCLACLLPAGSAQAGTPAPASGQNPKVDAWPNYRGNAQLQGRAQGRLANKFKLAWTFQTQAPVKSSAVISGGVVYIGSDDGFVYALDADKGARQWAFKTEGPIEAPPLVVADRVYVGSGDGFFYAVNAVDGKPLWKYQTNDRIVGAANWHRGDDHLAASVLVGSYDNFLYCIEPDSGKLRWKVETHSYVNSAPAVHGDRAVFGGCDGIVYVVSIASGEIRASIDLASPIAGAVALDGDRAYIGHYGNEFVAIDLAGKRIVWRFQDQQFPYFSSAAVGTDRVVFGSRAKRVYAANRKDGKPIWAFRAAGKVDSSPVICGDKVVVGSDDGRVYVLNLDRGTLIWSYLIGQAVTSSPAIANGMIVLGAQDGTVYAFKPDGAASGPEAVHDK